MSVFVDPYICIYACDPYICTCACDPYICMYACDPYICIYACFHIAYTCSVFNDLFVFVCVYVCM